MTRTPPPAIAPSANDEQLQWEDMSDGPAGRRDSISQRRGFSSTSLVMEGVDQHGHDDNAALSADQEQLNGDQMVAPPGPSGDGAVRVRTADAGVQVDPTEVVTSFMVASYQRDLEHGIQNDDAYQRPVNDGSASPGSAQIVVIPELEGHQLQPANSTTSEIGRCLAILGDEFLEKHGAELDSHVKNLLPTLRRSQDGNIAREAYDAFKDIAAHLFNDGFNWGRVVALLCFGYRMFITLFKEGWRNFAPSIVQLVVRYMVNEGIVRWIANNGGWLAATLYQFPVPVGVSGRLMQYFGSIAIMSALLISVFSAIRSSNLK